jgi:hypothetical protein
MLWTIKFYIVERAVILLLAACLMLVSSLKSSSTLKTEETCSSEMSVDFQRNTYRYIPEDINLDNHGYENLKSYNNLH